MKLSPLFQLLALLILLIFLLLFANLLMHVILPDWSWLPIIWRPFLSTVFLLLGILFLFIQRWRKSQGGTNVAIADSNNTLLMAVGDNPEDSLSDFFRRFPVNVIERKEAPSLHISFEVTHYRDQGVAFTLHLPQERRFLEAAVDSLQTDWPSTELLPLLQEAGLNFYTPEEMGDIPTQVSGEESIRIFRAPFLLTEGDVLPPHEGEQFHDKIRSLLSAMNGLPRDTAAGVQYLIRPAPRSMTWRWKFNAKRLRKKLQPTEDVRFPLEEDVLKRRLGIANRRLDDKASLYEIVPYVWAAHTNPDKAKAVVRRIGDALVGEYRGGWNLGKLGRIQENSSGVAGRHFPLMGGFILTAHELNAYLHLPDTVSAAVAPRLLRAGATAPPVDGRLLIDEKAETGKRIYGRVQHADGGKAYVGHALKDTQTNAFIVGSTGTGKSTLLKNIILQDWMNGNGVLVIDPKADLARDFLDLVPSGRVGDVVYLDLEDSAPFGFNMALAGFDETDMTRSVEAVMEAIQIGMGDNWEGAVTMQEIFSNGLMLLLVAEGERASMVKLERLINEVGYRKKLMRSARQNKQASSAIRFWQEIFPMREEKEQVRSLQVVNRRLSVITKSFSIRRVLGMHQGALQIGQLLEAGALILAPMPQTLSPSLVRIWSALLVREYMQVAFKRGAIPEGLRAETCRGLTIVVDELAQTIGHFPEMVQKLLAVGRAFKSSAVLSTQFYEQLPETVAQALKENALTQIAFRVGEEDKRLVTSLMGQPLTPHDVGDLAPFHAYMRLGLQGGQSKVVKVKTLPPAGRPRLPRLKDAQKPEPLPLAFAALLAKELPETLDTGAECLAFLVYLLRLNPTECISLLGEKVPTLKGRLMQISGSENIRRNEGILMWLASLPERLFNDTRNARATWDLWRYQNTLAQMSKGVRPTHIRLLSRLRYGTPWWEKDACFIREQESGG